ncbi:hypothetical protein GQF01_00555 [Paenibacillus sp. 5J-6]|uniref:Uncharacterized protein n=1 Tax=Paenibacillus silvestris TaxID=2606219 RepID=A0A6L8URL0_9BACL|nr:hypothetical protein [Paenibacillus silvestris]MZQ80645.1 hypothetical protein [Paenibacillus silvestris]
MLNIQLAPKLHDVVHMLKNIELNQVSTPLLAGISKEETAAVMKTFTIKEKKQTEPICNWW